MQATHKQNETEPLGGQPAPGSKQSVPDLDAQVAYQRAFEAVVWAIPAVSIYRLRAGAVAAFGAEDNDILLWSRPCTPATLMNASLTVVCA